MQLKHLFLLLSACLAGACSPKWKMAGDRIATPWAAQVDPKNARPEYPRPEMARSAWKSLNGLWSYAIQDSAAGTPSKWQGNILVPFPVESALSGVQKPVNNRQRLWYRTLFSVPESWRGQQLLLHFEAVDWSCEVWVNGRRAGAHAGGYDPFSMEIGSLIKAGKNEIVVSVYDPTDTGFQGLGKQTLTPGGIFYTAVTGIWQPVWLEPVNAAHFDDYQVFTDIDQGQVRILPFVAQPEPGDEVIATASFQGANIASKKAKAGETLTLSITQPKLWEPGNPNLYDLNLQLVRKGRVVDVVSGYFGMRKVSLGKDAEGFTRILINNKFIFQNGPLDQGFWPDGIYSQPTEEAMKYDLEMVKAMGFNMLRKHVKVEPRRFYYWCDKMGILVWQDMPNGDQKINPEDPDIKRSQASAEQFEMELKQLIKTHFNHPSIIMWVPFNEGWGQYETPRIVQYVKQLDPTRLVNNTSGWSDRGVGDVLDWHHYPAPTCPPAEPNRAIVLGEFGGLGLKTEGHMWETANWGYSSYADNDAMLADYESYYAEIWQRFIGQGLSACIYTQLTDVETEANGLMTYDRKVTKARPEVLFNINTGRFIPAPRIAPHGGMIHQGDTVRISASAGASIRYSIDGSMPDARSPLYTGPFILDKSAMVRAQAFDDGQSSRVATAEFTATNRPRPRYLLPYSQKYPAGHAYALVDGRHGSPSFSDGNWQGFSGNNLEVVFELETPRNIKSVNTGFLEHTDAWIFLPLKMSVFLSMDGEHYEKAGDVSFELPAENRPSRLQNAAVIFTARQAKFIKVVAENPGKCPEWHSGKGRPCWIFADEVVWE